MPKTVTIDISALNEGESKGFEHEGTPFFAVLKDGQYYLYRNSCPHLGIELEWNEDQFLDSEGALIQCSTHGALFVIEDGECVGGPCLGDRLEALPFKQTGNTLDVTLPD